MCEKTKAVLDILETRKKPLTKGEIMTVFKKVVEDSEKMGVRMTNIEKRMSSLLAEKIYIPRRSRTLSILIPRYRTFRL